MERTKVISQLYRQILVLVWIVVAGVWLFEFFAKDSYSEPIYRYTNFWVYLILPALFFVILIWIRISNKKTKKGFEAQIKRQTLEFKDKAERFDIDFEACEIDHNEYHQEIIINPNSRQQYRENVRFSECVIKVKVSINNEDYEFISGTLYIEPINLRMKLYQHKGFSIYIDCDDLDSTFDDFDHNKLPHYFDLEFLGREAFKSPDPRTVSLD